MFTERLLADIEREPFYFEKIIQTARNAKRVVIWGMGNAGRLTRQGMNTLGAENLVFTGNFIGDSNTRTYCESPVIFPNELRRSDYVLIACNPKYSVEQELKQACITCDYIDPEFFMYVSSLSEMKKKLTNNKEKIDKVYELIEDERSKEIFYKVLLHRFTCNLRLIQDIYEENQYFGNRIVKSINGYFVDCGAYNGDTLKRFLKQENRDADAKYYAFEADKNNYDQLCAFVNENSLQGVECFKLGVWNRHEQLCFANGIDNMSGGFTNTMADHMDLMMDVDSLDHVLQGRRVDMIAMDIEGSELNALEGAQELIKDQRPMLAISAYHKLEHLWEIPLYMNSLSSDYQIYFAHHRWNMHDTVCYGIIGDIR